MSQFALPIVECLQEPLIPHHYRPQVKVPSDWSTEYAQIIPQLTDLDVTLTATEGGILAVVNAEIEWKSVCSRCADEAGGVVELELSDYYESPSDTPDEDGLYHDGTYVDLESRIREEAVLALPLLPLCDLDCEGLCQDCGVPWRELDEDHDHEQIDPRFSALASLLEGRNE